MAEKEFSNLDLVLFASSMQGGHAVFVSELEIGTFIGEKFQYFVVSRKGGVESGGAFIDIENVKVCGFVDQKREEIIVTEKRSNMKRSTACDVRHGDEIEVSRSGIKKKLGTVDKAAADGGGERGAS